MSASRDFVHLHLHSEYSLLDGSIRAADLASLLVRNGMRACAVTDHGSLFGAIEFYDAMTREGLRPIIGMEAYLSPTRLDDRENAPGKSHYNHLTLLAMDERGYRNLCRLSSIGYLEGFYYKPRIDREVLAAHSEGLAIGSACLQGEIAQHLLQGDEDAAARVVSFYHDLVGRDRFFIELMDHGLPDERRILPLLSSLSRRTGARVAATNDAHYLARENSAAHDVLLCVQTGRRVDDPGRMRFESDEFYVKSGEEMSSLFDWIPESIAGTAAIAEMCDVHLGRTDTLLPAFPLPEGSSMESCLAGLAGEGLRKRLGRDLDAAETERLSYELDVIDSMGFPGYFLIVSELSRWARSNGIAMGPGRGSAAGSLVSFATGITDVNPLEHGLSFERFLNPSRHELPDIDLDFCFERRPEVIEHIVSLYGRRSVCQIVTFNRMKSRSVLKDVGRAMGMPFEEVDRLSKLMAQASDPDAPVRQIAAEVPQLAAMLESDPRFAEMISHCEYLENMARNTSVHAAGVIISPGDLLDYVPLYRTKEEITTQYEMKSLDRAGLLKLDVLGLRTVTMIQRAEAMVRSRGVPLVIEDLPLDDEETLALLRTGETVGVFQLESSGMREVLRKIGVNRFQDISAAVAIFRPGSMHMIDLYAQNKQGVESGARTFRIRYAHPEMEAVLSETYGVMIYQEQVMAIANRLAGMSMAEADTLRKAMSKKNPEVMALQRERFIEGAVSRGVPRRTATEVFDQVEKFAGYGFNKSHTICYALLSYRTAYLKAHHPAEFYAASMASETGNIDRLTLLAEDARRMGVTIRPPSVNESGAQFSVGTGGEVVYALSAVRNVGEGPAREIERERVAAGPYRSIFDLCSRVDLGIVSRRALESLAGAGATDCLGRSRAGILSSIGQAWEFGSRARALREAGQMSLFGGGAREEDESEPALPDVPEMDSTARLNLEKSLLGFYLSGHPMDDFGEDIGAFSDIEPGSDMPLIERRRMRMAGVVTGRREIPTQNGAMAFVTIEGRSGSSEVIAFSEALANCRDVLEPGSFVMIEGEVTQRRDERRLSITSAFPISEARHRLNAGIRIRIDTGGLSVDALRSAVELIAGSPGRGGVTLDIRHPSGRRVRAVSRSMKVDPADGLLRSLREILGEESVALVAGNGSSR